MSAIRPERMEDRPLLSYQQKIFIHDKFTDNLRQFAFTPTPSACGHKVVSVVLVVVNHELA